MTDKTAKLEQELQSLREENEILTERAEDFLLLGIISEKIGLAKTEDEVISLTLESISSLKDIYYSAYLSCGDNSVTVKKDYAFMQDSNSQGRSFSFFREVEQALGGAQFVFSCENISELPEFIPSQIQDSSPKGYCLIPVQSPDTKQKNHVFVFAFYLHGVELIESMLPLLCRAIELAYVKVESVNLLYDIRTLNQSLEEKVKERTEKLEAEATKHKKTAQELLLTQFAIEKNSDAVFWINSQGHFTYVNEAACKSLGYSREELMDMGVPQVDPNFPENLWPDHWREIKEKGWLQIVTQHQRKDGTIFPVEVGVNFIEFEGEELNCSFVRDITDRKELELKLQQSQKMEAIGALAGGIAHDFNNILTPIIGYTEMAQAEIIEHRKAANYLGEVLQASSRAKDLVQQILAFSRQSSTLREPLGVQHILKEVAKLLRATIPSTIEIRQNISDTANPVMASPTEIHQVIMNLSTNAYHSMRKDGGVLTLSLEDFEIEKAGSPPYLKLEPGSYLRIEVKDTGHGIPLNIVDRIFDPYFTTKEKGDGTGMGLATVHGIVQSHGGDVRVLSEAGKGSTFEIFLPSIEKEVTEAELKKDKEKISVKGHENILVIDDDDIIAMLQQEILEKYGYKVTIATDSLSALLLFEKHPDRFDLVLTDMTMPKMTGLQLAHRIRKVRPDIPIILCTGYSDVLNEEGTELCGINDLLMKPVSQEVLVKSVRKVLDG